MRIYESWTPEYIAEGSILRAQSLFALGWFHSVIQERRNFIPQGWNKFYEFSSADLRSSADIIDKMCKNGTPQWRVIHGLLENAIYGARVDDPQDALKLNTYLKTYFNNDVLTIDGKNPTRNLCSSFALPKSNQYSAYKKIIQDLPESDDVSLFGLPANIDRTFQRNSSDNILIQLRKLIKQDSLNSGLEKENWTREITPFITLWKQIIVRIVSLRDKYTGLSTGEPIDDFIDLELTDSLSLIGIITKNLDQISKIISGLQQMTNDLQQIVFALIKGETPVTWLSLWEGPETVSVFMKSLIEKTILVNTIKERLANGTFYQHPIGLSDFLNPIIFLNAHRQQTSRKMKVSIDSLRLVSSWNNFELKDCPVTIQIHGLLIQGCGFDGSRLLGAGPNDNIFNNVPVFQMGWVKNGTFSMKNKLEIPIYSNTSREYKVATLIVPCDDPTQWILAGVACVLKVFD
jgi:dynein heavy chain 2